MKKIVCFLVILSLCVTTYLGIGNKSLQLSGDVIANGEEKKAEAVVKYKIRNQMFGFQNLKGSISISLRLRENMTVKHNFMNVYKSGDIYYVDVSYYSENRNSMAFGKMYFDNRMENIVLETEEVKFISADKVFCEYVRGLNLN